MLHIGADTVEDGAALNAAIKQASAYEDGVSDGDIYIKKYKYGHFDTSQLGEQQLAPSTLHRLLNRVTEDSRIHWYNLTSYQAAKVNAAGGPHEGTVITLQGPPGGYNKSNYTFGLVKQVENADPPRVHLSQ